MTPQSKINTGPFTCLECGSRVGELGRTQSPIRIISNKDPNRPRQLDFCGQACASIYTNRPGYTG